MADPSTSKLSRIPHRTGELSRVAPFSLLPSVPAASRASQMAWTGPREDRDVTQPMGDQSCASAACAWQGVLMGALPVRGEALDGPPGEAAGAAALAG